MADAAIDVSKQIFAAVKEMTPAITLVKLDDLLDPDLKNLTLQELENTRVTEKNFGEVLMLKHFKKYAVDNKAIIGNLSTVNSEAFRKMLQKMTVCQSYTPNDGDVTL